MSTLADLTPPPDADDVRRLLGLLTPPDGDESLADAS